MITIKKIKRQVAGVMAFVMLSGLVSFGNGAVMAGTDNTGAWGDLGNGYYNNPVLPADYSDPDVIRVGKDYYLITSTFVQSPGITVLHSEDLVNWEIIGAAVKDLTQIDKKYNWDSMSGYGRGIWAPCISYNPQNQRFYIHFGDPDFGMYMTYTDDIYSNNWSDPQEVLKPDGTGFGAGWDDCGMLWDDNGQGYFAATHFADGYKDYIFKIDQNGYQLQDEGVLVHQTDDGLYTGSERNPEALKLFKKDGLYYFYHNGIAGGKRKAFIMRSESIYGKHENGDLGTFENPGTFEHIPYPIVEGTREPNQGNLIDIIDDNGDTKWFFWTHQGSTDLDGRPNSLVPITWNSDGWPVAGYDDIKKAGSMLWENIKKPISNSEIKRPQTSDEFDSNELGLQWMWNCQPRNDYWSLTEREGFLRLKAFMPVKSDSLDRAGNSLIQRMYRTDGNVVKTKMDISHMEDGEFAGLLYIMGSTTAGIGVNQANGIRQIRYKGKSDSLGEEIPSDVQYVYLKSEWENPMLTRSYYSFDGVTYKQFGEEFQIVKSNYRGGHIGFFNFNNLSDSGYVDFDYLHYEMDVNENPPVVMGVDNGGVYGLPVNVRYSRGTAKLNGTEITSGQRVSGKGDYIIEVTDGDKKNSVSFSLTEDAVEPGITVPFYMNLGGAQTESGSNIWTKDIDYRDSYWGVISGEKGYYDNGKDSIYQTDRHGKKVSMRFDGIEQGYYKVKLYFMENENQAEAARKFEVMLQDVSVGEVDIYKEAGFMTPLIKEYDGIEISDYLTVDLEASAGEASLCAVEIVKGNKPEETPRPPLIVDEVLFGTYDKESGSFTAEDFGNYTFDASKWTGNASGISVMDTADIPVTNCGVAPVTGKALNFGKNTDAVIAFKEPVKNGQVGFSADYAQGTRVKKISLVDSTGKEVFCITCDQDSNSAKLSNLLFIDGVSVLEAYVNNPRSEHFSVSGVVIDVDENTIEYTVGYSVREGSSNNWKTETKKAELRNIKDIAGMKLDGMGASYNGFIDNVVLYSKIPDQTAAATSTPVTSDKPTSVPSTPKPTSTPSVPEEDSGIKVDFTDSSSIANWSNASKVSFHKDSLIGNYMIADGAAAGSAPKTPVFESGSNMIVEFDMMLPSKKADGTTDNLIDGGNTGGVALMQGNTVAGVIGFRGNGQGKPDNILSRGGTGTDYVNALGGNKATAYFDTWMHYIFSIDTANKKGDIYMIDPNNGTVYTHGGRFDQYISSITKLTNIGIVSDQGYAIAVANLNVHSPEVTAISLNAEDNMTTQYIPGEGNVSTIQYSADTQYKLTYNKNGSVIDTDTSIQLSKSGVQYSILDEQGTEVKPQGITISENGLLTIESNAIAGKYSVMASCKEVSARLPLEIIANASASSAQVFGEDDVLLRIQPYQYRSIALADNGAVLPDKETVWSIVGEDLGCTISQDGMLTTGGRNGKITIRAEFPENGVSADMDVYLRTAQEAMESKVNVHGVLLSDGQKSFTGSNGISGIALNAKEALQNVKVSLKVYDKSDVCLAKQEYTVSDMKKQSFALNIADAVGLNKAEYVRVMIIDGEDNIISANTENITEGIYKGIPIVSDWVTGKNSGLGMGGAVLTPDVVPAGVDPDTVNTYTSEAKYTYDNYDAVIDEKVTTNNLLWYKTGAWSSDKSATIYARDGKDWEEQALPIGNGYMGGMLFGMPAKDHIQFNEETFWAAGYRGTQDVKSPSYVNPNMSEAINGFMNAGNVFVDFGMNRGETVTNYYRDLNLDEGVAHVQYEYNGVKYNREYFASYPKEVIALNYSADKDGALNFTVNPVSAHPGDITVENGEITIIGKLKDSEPYKGGGNAEWNQESDLEYCTKVKVILNDGTGEIIDSYGNVTVRNATNVTVLIAASTDYDPDQFVLKSDGSVDMTKTPYKNEKGVQAAIEKTSARMNNASAMTYADLKAEHMADYKSQFDKVSFSLTGDTICKTPTNELQQSYKNAIGTKTNADGTTSVSYDNSAYKKLDKHLEELHYNYARYMMISSSRATTMPATLQGKWCQSVSEIWGSCYCININMEMNYWFAGGADLLDSGKALIKWFNSQIPAGRVTAKNMYKVTPKAYTYADGKINFTESGEDKDDVFIMHTKQAIMGTTDMTGSTSIQSAGNTAWLMYNLWDLYQTSGDKKLLEEDLYPIMRKAANFYTQYLYTNMRKTTSDKEKYPDGYYYTTWAGRSPEQGPTQEGIKYDLQLVAGMYDYVIKAAEVLGVDSDKADAWKEIRNHLEIPVELGDDGQIKEWAQETSYNKDKDGKDLGDPVHRHISHLVGLYPGTLINRETPELLEGAKIVLQKRGDDATGWSCSNKFLLWARTLEGDKALELFRYQLAQKTYANLFDTHAPFQIDGNFGSAAAVMELLMQSHTGETYILPALPTEWDKGEISGIKAKDGSKVSIRWSEGKADEFTIVPVTDGDITVGYEKDNNAFLLNGKYIEFGSDDLYTIKNAKAGEVYTFTSTGKADRGINLTKNNVKAYGFDSGTLVVAGYAQNGEMLKTEIINGFEANLSGYEDCYELRAFLWNSIDNMQPLCDSVRCKL